MRGILMGMSVLVLAHTVMATPKADLVQAAGLSPFAAEVPAADFQLPNHEGIILRLHEQRGKVVFLNFWATWCAPCRHEMPVMQQLYHTFRQQPFVMWAVALQQGATEVLPFMGENNLHFTALLDLNGEVTALYAIRGLPTTYLIDCTGHIVGRAMGMRPWMDKAVHLLLRELFRDAHCR